MIGPLGPILLGPGPNIGPLGPIDGPLGLIPILMLSILVGEESCPGIIPLEDPTGFPSGPSIEPPRGEFIIPGSMFPMDPSPLSGPWPMEFGVEQGVDTWPVNCWDICAMLLIGSKAFPAILQGLFPVLDGVAGFRGMLLELSGPSPSCEGDIPP